MRQLAVVILLLAGLSACSKSDIGPSNGGSGTTTASAQLNWDQGNWNQSNWQ